MHFWKEIATCGIRDVLFELRFNICKTFRREREHWVAEVCQRAWRIRTHTCAHVSMHVHEHRILGVWEEKGGVE
jgi:hypothetical protein